MNTRSHMGNSGTGLTGAGGMVVRPAPYLCVELRATWALGLVSPLGHLGGAL